MPGGRPSHDGMTAVERWEGRIQYWELVAKKRPLTDEELDQLAYYHKQLLNAKWRASPAGQESQRRSMLKRQQKAREDPSFKKRLTDSRRRWYQNSPEARHKNTDRVRRYREKKYAEMGKTVSLETQLQTEKEDQ